MYYVFGQKQQRSSPYSSFAEHPPRCHAMHTILLAPTRACLRLAQEVTPTRMSNGSTIAVTRNYTYTVVRPRQDPPALLQIPYKKTGSNPYKTWVLLKAYY